MFVMTGRAVRVTANSVFKLRYRIREGLELRSPPGLFYDETFICLCFPAPLESWSAKHTQHKEVSCCSGCVCPLEDGKSQNSSLDFTCGTALLLSHCVHSKPVALTDKVYHVDTAVIAHSPHPANLRGFLAERVTKDKVHEFKIMDPSNAAATYCG